MAKSRKATAVRVVAAIFYMIASIIMFTSKKKIEQQFIPFLTKYTDATAILFCTVVNIPVCIYNILVLKIPSDSLLWNTIPFIDMMFCILSGTSLGVGWQIYRDTMYLPRDIIPSCTNWSPVCGVVPNFCVRILWSVICSTIAFILSFMLLGYSVLLSNGLFESFYF